MGPSVLRTENLILQVENESNAGGTLQKKQRDFRPIRAYPSH